jgi:hypothetical protein
MLLPKPRKKDKTKRQRKSKEQVFKARKRYTGEMAQNQARIGGKSQGWDRYCDC